MIVRIFFVVFSLLLAMTAPQTVSAQPSRVGKCVEGQVEHVTHITNLRHGQPVSLNIQPGQRVILAGNSAGTNELRGQSVVGVYFFPSGKGVGYSMDSLPAQDVTELLEPGENEIKLVAVEPTDLAWIVVSSTCSNDMVQAQATPKPAIVPTATITDSGIIAATATVRHVPENGPSVSEVETLQGEVSEVSTLQQAFSRRLVRILMGLVLLALLLTSAMGGFTAIRRRLGWD